MKDAFIKEICRLADANENIFLMVADMDNPYFEIFKKEHGERFLNVGIAEQNLAGVSAGLALEGKIPVIFGIANFVTMRCLDQIRNNIVYQNLNVKIVGVGAGLSYSLLGPSHHSLEDVAILRPLPNIRIIAPCDETQARKVAKSIVESCGPIYVRLARSSNGKICAANDGYEIGKANIVLENEKSQATVIGSGVILKNVLEAAEILEKDGIKIDVIDMHTVKPIDETAVLKAALKTNLLITIEEQYEGGLGSALAELSTVFRDDVCFKMESMTAKDFCKHYGSHDYLLNQMGIGSRDIAETVRKNLC